MENSDRFDRVRGLNWYAVHVRSRHEFKVTARLTGAGVEAFLPSVDRVRKWKDRKKIVTFPLFPGYVFVGLKDPDGERLPVLKTPGVVGFVGRSASGPEIMALDQVITLMKLVESREGIDPYPYLKEGNRVRIKSGPLTGVEGILIERKGLHVLAVSVDILRQGVSIQIDADCVESV
jgi:transcription antitermination factor NusG